MYGRLLWPNFILLPHAHFWHDSHNLKFSELKSFFIVNDRDFCCFSIRSKQKPSDSITVTLTLILAGFSLQWVIREGPFRKGNLFRLQVYERVGKYVINWENILVCDLFYFQFSRFLFDVDFDLIWFDISFWCDLLYFYSYFKNSECTAVKREVKL